MNAILKKIMELGAMVDRSCSEIERKLIINEAEELYIKHLAELNLLNISDVNKRLLEMEKAGKEATSLIAHLKDQHGFNEVEEEAQDEIMKVFKYEGRW